MKDALDSRPTRRAEHRRWWPPCFTGTIYFYPPSVTALYESIRHHTQVEWGPEVREWGMREIGLRDPNGYFITFAESVDR